MAEGGVPTVVRRVVTPGRVARAADRRRCRPVGVSAGVDANHQRERYIHLRLRLHSGKGQATALALAARFGRLAMFLRSKGLRPELSLR